jgi:hypothetical protein
VSVRQLRARVERLGVPAERTLLSSDQERDNFRRLDLALKQFEEGLTEAEAIELGEMKKNGSHPWTTILYSAVSMPRSRGLEHT